MPEDRVLIHHNEPDDERWWDIDVRDAVDGEVDGRVRCVGCGKFVAARRRWNQCPSCDVRDPEEK